MKNYLVAFFCILGFSAAVADDNHFCFEGEEVVACDQVVQQDEPQSLTITAETND